MIKRILLFQCIFFMFSCELYSQPTDFDILVDRQSTIRTLVMGTISVNGTVIGSTYENAALKIATGVFPGNLRYWSGHNFVQGPFGTIGHTGDLLIEVNVPGHTDVLLHGGNQPGQSAGCILLGGVPKDPDSQIPYLDNNSALRQLRIMFYGSDVPNSTPDKKITIEIQDHTKSIIGNWRGNITLPGVHPRNIPVSASFASISSGTITIVWTSGNPNVLQLKNVSVFFDGKVIASTSDNDTLNGVLSGDLRTLTGNLKLGGLPNEQISLNKD